MSDLRKIRVTLGLCVALLLAFAVTGATLSTAYLDTFPEALAGVFRHGSTAHLGGNVLVIFFGGLYAEERLGAVRFGIFICACAVLGTYAQYHLVGPNFVGASSISYGLLAYGVLADRTPAKQSLFGAFLILLVALEWVYLSQAVAVYVHISGALLGGSLAMFESFFGSRNPTLKPMQLQHVGRVVQIIAETDDDDAHEAEAEFLDGGLEGMFVLMQKGEVLGVTGYSMDEQVHDIAWLSWTYLSGAHVGAGLGSQMLNDLLGKLKDLGIRKVFIATSDYRDFGQDIYAAAHKMYEDFGATVELTVPDYHNKDEAKIVYGLKNPEYVEEGDAPTSDQTGLLIAGVEDEPETVGAVGLRWEERPVGVAGLDYAMEQAAKRNARIVVLALPGDLSAANAVALETHSFKICGELKDYYQTGLHQVWWICSLA